MSKLFTPTYLYIKQHSITNLKYFGKTIQDPHRYMGSGKYWKPHIKKHGKEYVTTIWTKLFENKEELVEFALAFSELFDIVESNDWANLKPENGIDGLDSDSAIKYTSGIPKSSTHKIATSLSLMGHIVRNETKEKISTKVSLANANGICGFSLGHSSKAGSIGGKSKSELKIKSSNKNLEKTHELHRNSVWITNKDCKINKRIQKQFLNAFIEYGWTKGIGKY